MFLWQPWTLFFWLTATKFVTLWYSPCNFWFCHFLHLCCKIICLGQPWDDLYLTFSCLLTYFSTSHIEMSLLQALLLTQKCPVYPGLFLNILLREHKIDQLQYWLEKIWKRIWNISKWSSTVCTLSPLQWKRDTLDRTRTKNDWVFYLLVKSRVFIYAVYFCIYFIYPYLKIIINSILYTQNVSECLLYLFLSGLFKQNCFFLICLLWKKAVEG